MKTPEIWTEQRAADLFIHVWSEYYVASGADYTKLLGGANL